MVTNPQLINFVFKIDIYKYNNLFSKNITINTI